MFCHIRWCFFCIQDHPTYWQIPWYGCKDFDLTEASCHDNGSIIQPLAALGANSPAESTKLPHFKSGRVQFLHASAKPEDPGLWAMRGYVMLWLFGLWYFMQYTLHMLPIKTLAATIVLHWLADLHDTLCVQNMACDNNDTDNHGHHSDHNDRNNKKDNNKNNNNDKAT